jgi:hypothetical protein
MMFLCDGTRYDSSEMETFETGQPMMPLVCMTRDHRCVFVVAVDRKIGVRAYRADAPHIREIALRFGLPRLLLAVPDGERQGQDSAGAVSSARSIETP